MPHAAMPDGEDVLRILIAQGLINEPQSDEELRYEWDEYADAAAEEWKQRTDWRPYLKDGADVTRYFSPPGSTQRRSSVRGGGRVLEFGAGLLTLTSLAINVSPTSAGSVLTQNVDFWLGPENADVEGGPWRFAEFRSRLWGLPRSVKVIGKWGKVALVPDDVWNRVRDYAAAGLACEQLGVSINGGLKSWREADGTGETYDSDPLGEFVQRSIKRFHAMAMREKFLSVG